MGVVALWFLLAQRVERFKQFGEGMFDRRGDERGFEDSLIRGFRGAMSFDGFGADPFFG